MYIRPFTKEIEQKAKKELNEVQSRKNAHLKNIREWLQKQPHLNARTGKCFNCTKKKDLSNPANQNSCCSPQEIILFFFSKRNYGC